MSNPAGDKKKKYQNPSWVILKKALSKLSNHELQTISYRIWCDGDFYETPNNTMIEDILYELDIPKLIDGE